MMKISCQSLAARIFARSSKPAARRRLTLRLAFLERLEERTLLSTVDIGSGTLLYNDGGAASSVTISLASASVEQITDPSTTIALGPTASIFGWSGSGTHTVTGPTSSFAFIQFAGTSTAGANLTLNYANGDPLPTAGMIFIPAAAAPGSTNHFTLQGGTFTSETYNGLASSVGNITYSDSSHSNTLITLINTNSVTDTTPANSFAFNAPSPAPTINIASGTLNGSNIYQVSDGGTATFPFINFDNKSIATINANAGNATITMNPTAAAAGLSVLNIDSTAANNTINLQNTSAGVITDVSSPNSTINIGNSFGTLAGITGDIDMSDSGSTTVNINDANDTAHAAATLDNASGNVVFPFEVSGLSTGTIAYAGGLSALNINTGISSVTAGVTFNINNTQTGTTTTLNGAGNPNFFNLSNAGEANGLNNLAGAVVIHGGANFSSVVTLNDSDASSSNTYAVTGTTVSRNNFGGLTYDGINSLTLDAENTGASGSNTINVNGTANDVTTTINSFGNGDTISLNSTGSNGTVALNTQTAGSTLNIIGCTSPVFVDMNASGTVNIGSTGGNGTMTGIQAAVSLINGPAFYDLNLHDENDTTAQTWTLNNNDGSNTANIGLSSGSPISYRPGDLQSLTVNGGSGGNSFNVNAITNDAATTLNSGAGIDTVNVLNSANTLTINGQAGSDTVNLGNNGSAQGLAGTINITNAGAFSAVNVNDSQDGTARTVAFSDDATTATVTGISPATLHLLDAGIASLTLNGGSGGNTFTVSNTTPAFTNTLNTGSGSDTVNVIATTGGNLTINGQGGTDTVTLGSNNSLQALQGAIAVGNAGGNTTLNLNNSADTTAHTTSISDSSGSTHITGVTPANITYADTGVGTVNLSTGATADTLTVNSTGADATLNITTAGAVAGNTLNIIACSAPINVTANAPSTVNVGSIGGNGTLAGIQGAVFIHNPLSVTAMNLHDENDTQTHTWTLDDNSGTESITPSGDAAVSCVNTGISALTVNAGSGGNTFNVHQTSEFGSTTLNTGAGVDTVNVFATGANQTLNITGQNASTVHLGGLATIGMQNMNGTINVTNPHAQTTLLLDDSQDATGRTTSVSDNGTTGTITGLCPATIHYATNNTNAVTIATGSGNDSATVNSNFVDLSLNDAGGSNNTLTIDSQTINPTITAGANSHQIVVSATESNGVTALHNVTVQGYGNVNLTDLPIVITPGSTQTTTSVVHTGFTNSTVADFTVNLPLIGSNATGLPIGDFTSGISWGDGTSNSAGTVIQDPNNPDHYFIDSSHTFNAIGAFSVAASAVFTPPAGVTSLATTLNGVNINLPLSNASKTANVTAISTTPNTSVFSPGPAKTATAGKLLNKIVIQLKTPQNKLDKTDNSSVTLSIASGPGNFANGSITTVNAIKGKATFSHLQLNTAGVYVITESNGEKTISSQTFTVAASKVASLTITPPPVGPTTATPLAFTVHAFDAFGNSVSKAPVKISVASAPPHAKKIVGTVTLKTTVGIAVFSNLFLHTPGSYVLKASSGSIFATTSEFAIT